MQNLRFGSAAEDAGLAMGRCIWRVTCWRHDGCLRISVTSCPTSCHNPEDLHHCIFLHCLLLEEKQLLFQIDMWSQSVQWSSSKASVTKCDIYIYMNILTYIHYSIACTVPDHRVRVVISLENVVVCLPCWQDCKW
jgi:hypothetical protein